MPVLSGELKNGQQWERLQAAIVLDEIGPPALPVLEEIRAAMTLREELYSGGKYTVRVINRALNRLEGTDRLVPEPVGPKNSTELYEPIQVLNSSTVHDHFNVTG